MEIMPGFTLTDIDTTGARIRLRHGGSGPPLLLLHGNPLTHVAWHKVAPRLAERFYVVAADLRGYGDSSAPPEEPDHSNYSFRAMARDQVEVMKALGYDQFYVAGHDRGGRTTHRMCLDHPEKVIKAAIIDIVPTLRYVGRRWTRSVRSAAGTGRSWRNRSTSPSACWVASRPTGHAQETAEADRRSEPHSAGNLERICSLL